jgi:hypothetical protein
MSTITASPAGTTASAASLRHVHLARAAFALVWAAVFAATGAELGALATTLLVLYPAVDAAAGVLDLRSSRARGERAGAAVATVVVSGLAAVGLAVAAADDGTAVLRVWGTWAVVSGIAQLVGALQRRGLRGQRFLVASGGLSVLAGASFVLSAGGATSLTGLAGYAALGGVFFLVSALRLRPGSGPEATIAS